MRLVACTAIILLGAMMTNAAEVDEVIKEAKAALKKGDVAAAMKAASKAVELDPKSPSAVFTRGEVYAAQRKHAEAIKDFDAALALDKDFLIAVDRRGGEKFKLGQ